MKTLQKDLTTGNPGKIIFNFTLPSDRYFAYDVLLFINYTSFQ